MMDRQQKKKGITTSFKSGSTDNNNTDGHIHIFNHHVYDQCYIERAYQIEHHSNHIVPSAFEHFSKLHDIMDIWFQVIPNNTTILHCLLVTI